MVRKTLTKFQFWLLLALMFASQLMIVGGFFLAIRFDLDAARRALLEQLVTQRIGPLLLLALLLVTAQGLALKALIQRYLLPMARMAEEAVLLMSNPAYRIVPQGAREVRELAARLNTLASAHQRLRDGVQAEIAAANGALAEERNRLAALMSDLAQSVLVCNLEGRILLYNTRARQLFGVAQGGGAAVGLGRSVFGLLERGLIVHALEQLQYKLQHPDDAGAGALSVFVTSLREGPIVRVHMAPVLDGAQALNGFVLTLEDITRSVEADDRRAHQQQLLTQDARGALANIRAALESVEAVPRVDGDKLRQLAAAIGSETYRLAQRIDEAERQHADARARQWRPEEMRGSDLLALLQRRIDGLRIDAGASDAEAGALWLQVESYALTQALAYLAQRLVRERDASGLKIGLTRAGRHAHLVLSWSGSALPADTLRSWEDEYVQLNSGSGRQLASFIAARRDAAQQPDSSGALSSYSVRLPLVEPRAALDITLRQPGRPEFYDFDLFHQPGQNAALDERPLSELSYTVFDTETTGLHPAAGDEIISIGALRIVNGRLLEQESFEMLVQPGQQLKPESTAIHGISDAMLKGRPRIGEVLPQFHRFAEDTVLVAHNAAFDMKFLQMKEEQTGVRFSQPVLDTLLLSQVLHPHQEQHSLEAIARRFGIDIVGRHTALGDAVVTGEVFLKMIPLLAEKGIFTLKQAREAEQRTAYARIRY